MKRNIFGKALWVVFVLIAVVGIGCSRNGQEVVKVGVVLPLTGDLAQYGQSELNGIQLAVEEYATKSKGHVISIIIEDDKGDAKTGVSATNKLISLDNVPLIIGSASSGITLAIAPVVENKKVVLISPTSTATSIKNAGAYIFRVCVSDEYEAKAMADYVYENFRDKHIGILTINNDYGNGLGKDFFNYLELKKLHIGIQEHYDAGLRDFRPIITKLVNSQIDVLYLVAQKEQSTIFQQCRELNYRPQFTGSTMFEDPELISRVGDLADGSLYTFRSYDPEDTSNITRAFVAAYKNKYRNEPDFYSASGYDAALVAISAIQHTTPIGDSLMSYMYAMPSIRGATGLIAFDRNGDVQAPFSIKRIIGGKFEFVRKPL